MVSHVDEIKPVLRLTPLWRTSLPLPLSFAQATDEQKTIGRFRNPTDTHICVGDNCHSSIPMILVHLLQLARWQWQLE